ncbi:MAG TPA: sugar phosphate isomerase/epimerase [Vicinamibacteria bacterium]|nr:sugar phosphate isomerase/epimerase [Vicinamibacteria bacterium]
MTSRRSFLGRVAGGLAASSALRGIVEAATPGKPPLGLQLWSVRQQAAKDLPATLKQVKAWGFEEVEGTDDFHGRTAEAFAAELRNAGLRCRAMHVGFELLEKQMPTVLKNADALGVTTIVNPYLPHQQKPLASREDILKAASAFAGFAKQCQAAGKRFAYHTHGQEFGQAPEGTLFDVLAGESGPDVGFEFDVYWIVFGGGDPLALMDRYAGRVWFTHLKDMAKGVQPGTAAARREDANAVLGAGQIDIKAIVEAGRKAGVEVHYIEDESADPVAHIPQSVAYYQSL